MSKVFQDSLDIQPYNWIATITCQNLYVYTIFSSNSWRLLSLQLYIPTFLPVFQYRIAGFVCKVLICVNYVRCHGLAHFNYTVTFNSAIVLGVSQLCALLYLMWSKCRYLVSHWSSSLHWTAKDLSDCDDSIAFYSIFCYKTLLSYAPLWRCDHR